MKVMVTGASSQIGRFLLPRLIAAGHEPVALSRRQGGAQLPGMRWLVANIEDGTGLSGLSADILIHLAPIRLLPAVLAAFLAQGGRRVICFGTTSRYSKAASKDAREQRFAVRQIELEQALAGACAAAAAHWTLFRPTLIYGCGLDRNVTLIARAIRRCGFFPLLGDAGGLRQPVHADDLAKACVDVIDARQTFDRAYDLSGGETLSYRHMVERIFAAMGRRPRFLPVPLVAFRALMAVVALHPRYRDFNAQMARRMSEDLVFDSRAAMRDFGYAPRPFQPVFAS